MFKEKIKKILNLLCIPLAYLLRHPSIQERLWESGTFRPLNPLYHWSNKPNDIEEEVFKLATKQSAKYVIDNMPNISGTADRFFLLEYCVKRARKEGLFLEFGVYNGDTINIIADIVETKVHGFDSFKGLPEDWEMCKAGHFSRDGKLPQVRDNVVLHAGWFDKTLPKFTEQHKEPLAFLHVDSDLYSSARTILYGLKDQIAKETIIVFDEYFNYPNWQQHEFKAFQEFTKEHDIRYEYIAYCSRGYSVGVRIL